MKNYAYPKEIPEHFAVVIRKFYFVWLQDLLRCSNLQCCLLLNYIQIQNVPKPSSQNSVSAHLGWDVNFPEYTVNKLLSLFYGLLNIAYVVPLVPFSITSAFQTISPE